MKFVLNDRILAAAGEQTVVRAPSFKGVGPDVKKAAQSASAPCTTISTKTSGSASPVWKAAE